MKQKTLSQLKKKADKVFSEYVRRINADRYGRLKCYTCNKTLNVSGCHAGHFHARRHLATRWDEMNVKPQCPRCNLWEEGDKPTFAENLVREYGVGILEELRAKRNTSGEVGRKEIEEVISYYGNKLKLMEGK